MWSRECIALDIDFLRSIVENLPNLAGFAILAYVEYIGRRDAMQMLKECNEERRKDALEK